MNNNIKFTIAENIVLMATQYANKNWKVFVRDKSTNQEELVDRSVNGIELKFLIDHAIKLVSKKTPISMTIETLKSIFQLIINNKKHEEEKQKEQKE